MSKGRFQHTQSTHETSRVSENKPEHVLENKQLKNKLKNIDIYNSTKENKILRNKLNKVKDLYPKNLHIWIKEIKEDTKI